MSIYCSLDDIHITGGKKMLASEFRLLWYGTNNLKWEVCVCCTWLYAYYIHYMYTYMCVCV